MPNFVSQSFVQIPPSLPVKVLNENLASCTCKFMYEGGRNPEKKKLVQFTGASTMKCKDTQIPLFEGKRMGLPRSLPNTRLSSRH